MDDTLSLLKSSITCRTMFKGVSLKNVIGLLGLLQGTVAVSHASLETSSRQLLDAPDDYGTSWRAKNVELPKSLFDKLVRAVWLLFLSSHSVAMFRTCILARRRIMFEKAQARFRSHRH